MKLVRKISIIFILFVTYIYVCYIAFLPNNYIIIQGEKLEIDTLLGISLIVKQNQNLETVQAASNFQKNKLEETGKIDLSLNLFDIFSVKDVTINVIPKTTVVPLGKAIGMKMYTEGVLVVGMSEIEGKKPYENSGIEAGDTIIEINNTKINSTDDLIECVNDSKGTTLEVKYISDEEEKIVNMEPAKTSNNEYKLGLWVRDAAAGVGTLTFYEPSTGNFASLGHGINDVDTLELINIANGELVTTNIIDIVKGVDGTPGEIRGSIDNGITLGTISKNTSFGVYGTISNVSKLNLGNSQEMEVANRSEIKTGKAEIMCELENGKIEKYEIEIQKLFKENNQNNKSMLIKVTDERLIEKTGGIIQGMSGAPIIQNGKFIGAVTHVLVNDSKTGYAVFADLMIKQMREVS